LITWVNVDNTRHYFNDLAIFKIFRDWYGKEFRVTGGEQPLQWMPPQTTLGITVEYSPGRTALNMDPYLRTMVAKHGLQECNVPKIPMTPGFTLQKADCPTNDVERESIAEQAAILFPNQGITDYKSACSTYRSVTMAIAWYANSIGGELQVCTSILGRGMQSACIKGFKALKQLLRYCKGEIGKELIYVKTREWGPHEFPQLKFFSDASFNDDPDTSKSQGGFVGSFDDQAAAVFSSGQSATVMVSTYAAEKHFVFKTCKQIMYLRMWLNEVGIPQLAPTPIFCDNAATVSDLNCTVPKVTRNNKHFTLQTRYANECADLGHVKIIKADGKDLVADALTKVLPREAFHRYSNRMHYGAHALSNVLANQGGALTEFAI